MVHSMTADDDSREFHSVFTSAAHTRPKERSRISMRVGSVGTPVLVGLSLTGPPARRAPWRASAPAAALVASDSVAAEYRAAEAAHAAEIERSRIEPSWPQPDAARDFRDEDFATVRFDERDAGPDVPALVNANLVSVMRDPIISATECDALVAEAAAAMESGMRSSFTYTAASRLGEVHVHDLPAGRRWLADLLGSTIFPLLGSRFGVASDELAVYDALVVRYDAARNATRQPVHRDASLLTVNLALSDSADYEGGGVVFEANGAVVQAERGHLMSHASGLRHAGNEITAGTRWVLVVFVLARGIPQRGSRCAARGAAAKRRASAAMREGRADEAEAALAEAEVSLRSALRASPADHEVLHSIAGLHLLRGEHDEARACLRRAVALYPHCPKLRNAAGILLLNAGRPRAALRYFEAALRRVLSADDDEAWEACVNGALCCASLLETRGRSPAPMDEAVRWLDRAFESAPDDARLVGLMQRLEAAGAAASGTSGETSLV